MSKAALTTTTTGEAPATEPATPTGLTRRRLLAGSGTASIVAAFAPTASAAAHPDAALIAACAAFHLSRANWPRSFGPQKVSGTPECQAYEDAIEELGDRECDMVHEIASFPALTITGLQAKARALLLWDDGEIDGADDQPAGNRLMWSITQDILNRSAAA